MNEPLTLVSLGALVPLIAAAVALGSVLSKVTRLGEDFRALRLELRADIRELSEKLNGVVVQQARNSTQIAGLEKRTGDREREVVAVLEKAFGVGPTRSGADNKR